MFTKCAKCGGGFFELQTIEPSGSNFKINVIQCSSCGAPIGLVDYYDTHSSIEKTNQKIERLHNEVNQLGYDITNIRNMVSNLR